MNNAETVRLSKAIRRYKRAQAKLENLGRGKLPRRSQEPKQSCGHAGCGEYCRYC